MEAFWMVIDNDDMQPMHFEADDYNSDKEDHEPEVKLSDNDNNTYWNNAEDAEKVAAALALMNGGNTYTVVKSVCAYRMGTAPVIATPL